MTKPAEPTLPSVAHLGTFPPTQCGLATFGAALTGAIRQVQPSRPVRIVDVVDAERPLPAGAAAQLVNGQPQSVRRTAQFIAGHDALLVEHEFGIFGGRDGDEVLRLLEGVLAMGGCSAVTVLHTVLETPTPHQRTVLENVAASSERLVVMSRAAEERLLRRYDIQGDKVRVVPHGARLNPPTPGRRPTPHRPTVLTWGLLGPGKGLESAIDAMAVVSSLIPQPRYVVAGQTHPKVQAQSGEQYRHGLQDRVRRQGLDDVVEFDDAYRDLESLAALIRSADVVLLPYETREQVTSGVLVEAIASERPVVSTDFPHARELLVDGAGLVVPHGDPEALGLAVAEVLTRPRLAESMQAAARRIAASLAWDAVARQYCGIIDEAVLANVQPADGTDRSSSARVA
jgi:glycosyltransferase involved in cell wall biosynthesis